MGFCLSFFIARSNGDNSQVDASADGVADEKVTRMADEQRAKQERETKKVVTTFHPATLPGHTGYLTFATFPPSFTR